MIILLSILPIICTKSVFKNITSIVGFDDKCINSINSISIAKYTFSG